MGLLSQFLMFLLSHIYFFYLCVFFRCVIWCSFVVTFFQRKLEFIVFVYFVRVLVFFYFLCRFDLDSDLAALGDRLQGDWDRFVN